MKKFNLELLSPIDGKINAHIFENTYVNIPETLFYKIQINLKEFTLENESFKTSIVLDFIKFNIKKLKDLENRTFEFPINPTEGYIDSSIYLFNVHNPFDVKQIAFSEISNSSIVATFYFDIDFEFEKTGYEKVSGGQLKVPLSFGRLFIDEDLFNAETGDISDAKKLVSKHTALEDYEEPTVSDGRIIFKMKNI